MKKIIGIVIGSLMFANIGFAKMALIEETVVKGPNANYHMAIICIDGHRFVMTGLKASGRSVVQFYRMTAQGRAVPATCF